MAEPNYRNQIHIKDMEVSSKIQNLNFIADELENKLIIYSKKENTNSNYIESQYKLIKDIRDAADGLGELEPIDVWLVLLACFKHYQNADKDGYVIYLPVKRNPKKARFIQIDLTESEGVNDSKGKSND